MQVFGATPTHKLNPLPENPAVRVARWLREMVRCQHSEISRPFTRDGETYRACLRCGARRPFNLNAWEMKGGFYYKETPADLPVENKAIKPSPRPSRVKPAA